MAHLTRSRAQQEQTALNLLRVARDDQLIRDDDGQIDYATRMMGEAMRPLIGRVHARYFNIMQPN